MFELDVKPGHDEAASRLEYEMFLRSGYVEANDERRVLCYDRYPRSVFICASDASGDLRGTMRLIHATSTSWSETHFPTLDDFAVDEHWLERIHSLPARELVEVASMAVRPGTSRRCGREIIRQSMRYIWSRNIWFALSSVDSSYLRELRRRRLPFSQIGAEKLYMGSMTVPTFFDSLRLPLRYQPVVRLAWAWHAARARVARLASWLS